MDVLHLFSNLNEVQRTAVQYAEGPLLILAGAGTGKTKVLTARIANIIHQQLALPQNILAVTFTNKAAREMQQRIRDTINCEGLNIGTFHSIAAKILRYHISYLNLESSLNSRFTIIDEDDQLRVIKEAMLRLNIDSKVYTPKSIRIIISRWKDIGLQPTSVSNSDLKLPIQKVARDIYITYQRQLIASNVVDFGDLLLYSNEIFIRNSNLLAEYQNKYRYILIDEYQDTNVAQYLWIRMLASASRNLCCVGDEDQSIYSWRGAEVGNIMRFSQDFPDAKIIKLEQNYRSSKSILAAASNIINNNKNRHVKSLWTNNTFDEKIRIISCWNDQEEARFVVNEVERFIKNNLYPVHQIAILVRAGYQTRAFEEVLISRVLPYRIVGSSKFYDRAEVRDLLAYIRIALNMNDNLALERIINVPRRSVGSVTLKQIKDYAITHNMSALHAIKEMLKSDLLKTRAQDSLRTLVTQIESWGTRYQNEPAVNVTKAMLHESEYIDLLRQHNNEESKAKIENINEMLNAISEFDNIHEFVEHASLVMDNDILASHFGGTISIMTLHAAKGLEFAVVFLPGWEEGIVPHQKATTEDGDRGLEEERRIAYVGITRAKELLYITFAERRFLFYEIVSTVPSRFLAEIPGDVCMYTSSSKRLNSLDVNYKSPLQNQSLFFKQHSDTDTLRPGTKVSHNQFGNGTVICCRDDNIEVIFADHIGIKTIKQSFLSRLES